jgi:hypothetical protein
VRLSWLACHDKACVISNLIVHILLRLLEFEAWSNFDWAHGGNNEIAIRLLEDVRRVSIFI